MQHPKTLALTALLAAPLLAPTALAQGAPSPAPASSASATAPQGAGTIQEIVVVGTTDLLANFLQATLSAQPGAPLSGVNLRQIEQEVIASGYFKAAVAELRTVSGRDVLYVTVTPNPTIGAVDVTGLTFLPPDAFKKSVADLLNIAPGATLNTGRLEQAKEALATNYRTEGYPLQPSISSTVKTNADGSVNVVFLIDETAPVNRVEVSGVTLLPASTVTAIFKPLYDARKFTPEAYFQAVQAVTDAYNGAGVLQAGVDLRTTRLEGGVLKVQVIEAKVDALDTAALGDVPAGVLAELQTREGQPVTLARLRADVRTLANQTGKPVRFGIQPNPEDPSAVTVLFGADDVTAGPVRSVAVQGNTLVPTATLLAALKTKTGDAYSLQLAQEDFLALRDVYRKAGYEISTRDAITFKDGALTFNVREVRVTKYELKWQGEHKTAERVVLRELPEPGGFFNANTLRESLGRVSRLGFVRPVDYSVRNDDPQNPENVTYVLTVTETGGGLGNEIGLGLGYDGLSGGWSGDARYGNNNVFGLGHVFSATLSAQQNDAGQNLVGNVRYTIPWLDVDFLDFRKTPTSLSVSAGSSASGNNALLADPKDVKSDTNYDYTVRNTSFSVSAGRVLAPNLRASVGTGVTQRTYFLEAVKGEEKPTLSPEAGAALLPRTSLTTNLSAGLNYDSADSAEFPTTGYRADLNAVYSFGRSGETPLGWTDLQGGASTYWGFGKTTEKALGLTSKQQVFAVRANAGTTFGAAPSGTGYVVGGGSAPAPRQIRGLEDGALFGPNYFTASAEYRYDFGLNAGVAQGLYGVVFADAGSAWGTETNPNFDLKYGVGAGLQLDLGLGGTRLPSLRFDYGYSPQNGTGKFYFSLGQFW